jgi:hypothetical protein
MVGHNVDDIVYATSVIKSAFDTRDCIACHSAKQHRNPFPASENHSTQKGQRIYTDIAGPFPTSPGGSKYWMTFLDEISHFVWVHTIPDKTSATICKTFVDLRKQLKTQGVQIKSIRTDGGGEYFGELEPTLTSLGILHQNTCPYTIG